MEYNTKNKENKQLRRLFVFVADITIWLLLTALWGYMWLTNYADKIARPFGYKGHWLVIALYAILLFLLTHMYGGYKVGHYRQLDIFFSGMLALLFTNVISYIQSCLLSAKILSLWPVFLVTLLGLACILLWSIITQKIYRYLYPPYNMLMVYDGKAVARALVDKMSRRGDKYRVCETVGIQETDFSYIEERMKAYSSVILCDLPSSCRNDLLKFAYKEKISVYVTPKLSDILVRSAESIELFDSPLLLSQNQDLSIEQRIGKRAMDIVISLIGIIITSPFMLIIALAIKLSDKGPVFFNQERLTLNGKVFKMYKFRSMVVDADKIEGNRLASKGDPRITPVGRFIRKIRVDELPQLFNILKGDMSVVGPRPESPDIAAFYEESIPEFSYRLNVKAGLTGYAQVVGKYNTEPYDKLKMDFMYITNYSFLLDIKILLKTFKIIFNFESTEGISEDQKTARRENE